MLMKALEKRAGACHASGDDVLHCSIRQKVGRLELPEQLLGAKLLRLEHPAQDVPGPGHRREHAPSLHVCMHAVNSRRQGHQPRGVQHAETDLLAAQTTGYLSSTGV